MRLIEEERQRAEEERLERERVEEEARRKAEEAERRKVNLWLGININQMLCHKC